jgi:salicylate hydroxylase
MASRHFLIVGAGLGGLTAALALLKAGFSVEVHEQSPQLGEIGAGIMVTPNSARVLIALGLGPALQAKGVQPTASVYRRFDTNDVMMQAPLRVQEEFGAPNVHIHRADLHAALVNAVRALAPACLHLDHKLVDFSDDGERVRARFANGHIATGDILLGSDGIRSAVRAALFGDGAPQFTGQVAWRGLVPAEGLPDSVTAPVSNSWIGENRHIIQYRLRGGRLINYVAIVAETAWTEEGWNVRSDVADVVAAFTGWNDDVIALLRATDPAQCFKWGLFDRDPLAIWSRGRVTLLGDAAHPMLPFMAQGSAMAIEDGMVFANAQTASADALSGITRYEALRQPRASWVVLQSRAATRLYQSTGGNKTEERARNLATLYGYDAVNAGLA